MKDVRIRKVKVLGGRALAEAKRQGLDDKDLVIVTTTCSGGLPKYELEKIEGSPSQFIFDKLK